MKELKETIIEAVQDATDTKTGRVSISYLDALLDELLPEALNIHNVVGRSEQLVAFLKWVGDGYDFKNNAEKIVKEYIDEGN